MPCFSVSLGKEHVRLSYCPGHFVRHLLTMASKFWPETHQLQAHETQWLHAATFLEPNLLTLTQHTSWFSAPHLLSCQLKGQHNPSELFPSQLKTLIPDLLSKYLVSVLSSGLQL